MWYENRRPYKPRYLLLAEQADRNASTDVVYEHAPDRPGGPPPEQGPPPGAVTED